MENPARRIVECVPNFSEGRDPQVIDRIRQAIADVSGVSVLHVDPGVSVNRTVITFVGEAEAVAEAAFRGVEKAGELIDMAKHHGTHPRIGATDVLPLVPVSGISLQECAELATRLARRISRELLIPCYLYEASALHPAHRNLAACRVGEYEGLPSRLSDEQLGPDVGRRPFDARIARTGCTVVGARDFLIAVNFNLNTKSREQAHTVAREVRERDGGLRGVKALGWYIEEYGRAQVSMNITDIAVTPLHVAFETVCRRAAAHGLRVTGTEIIGLLPLRCLTAAGRHFLLSQGLPTDAPDADLLQAAIVGMGLSDLRPFLPEEKVIELKMALTPQNNP